MLSLKFFFEKNTIVLNVYYDLLFDLTYVSRYSKITIFYVSSYWYNYFIAI